MFPANCPKRAATRSETFVRIFFAIPINLCPEGPFLRTQGHDHHTHHRQTPQGRSRATIHSGRVSRDGGISRPTRPRGVGSGLLHSHGLDDSGSKPRGPSRSLTESDSLKATFHRQSLASAVRDASQIATTRTPKDILKCVKLTISGDECRIEANDGESHVVRYLRGVECARPGSVLIPAAKLNAILSEVTAESIALDMNGTDCRIVCGRVKLTLPTQPAEDFPSVAEWAFDSYHTISAGELSRALRRTLVFCDTVSTRYALGGVNLAVANGVRASFQSTDSLRAAEQIATVVTTGEDSPLHGVTVVPHRGASALLAMLDVDPVDFAADTNSLYARSGDFTLKLQFVQGRFPDFSKIFLPLENVIPVVVGPLRDAFRQSLLTTSPDSKGVGMTFGGGTLLLSSKTADEGSSEVDIPVEFAGELKIRQDATLLMSALKLFDGADVLRMSVSEKAATLTLATEDGWRFMQMGLAVE